MARSYAQQPICPVDGGLLLSHADWGDRLHCPNQRHGGNGRMFAPGEWVVGTPVEYRGPSPATAAQVAEATERAAAHRAAAEAARADRPKPARVERAPRAAKEPKECLCGCGGMTKGGRFLPGHDARYHARMKAAAKERADGE